jgi:hypothetical protein
MRGGSSDKPKQLYFTMADICFGGFVDGGSQLRRRYSGQEVSGVGGKADHGGDENVTHRRADDDRPWLKNPCMHVMTHLPQNPCMEVQIKM